MSLAVAPADARRWAEDWQAVSLVVVVHHRTERALLASLDGVAAHATWLPAALVLVDDTLSPSVWAVTIPRWLASDRGLASAQPETA